MVGFHHLQTAFYLQVEGFVLPFQSCGDGRGFHLSGKTFKNSFNLKTVLSQLQVSCSCMQVSSQGNSQRCVFGEVL